MVSSALRVKSPPDLKLLVTLVVEPLALVAFSFFTRIPALASAPTEAPIDAPASADALASADPLAPTSTPASTEAPASAPASAEAFPST